ncbi:hypothetical protein WME97_22210 [Sorangium sp. So ce367]|uniref:hypothetical protein n=1 Tax=Sorangium sp. So ce367 TaxID=3133305 RepID=UPI003F606A9D
MEGQFSPLLARMFADKTLSLEAVLSYRGTVCARANARNGAAHVLSDALAEFLFDAQSTLGRITSASAPCVAAARRGACTMSMRFHGKLGLFCACSLVVAPAPALALEFSGGVSVGGIQVGTEPELAVSPFIGWLRRRTGDFRIEVHNVLSIVPGAGVGVYDRTAVTFGYTTKTGSVSLGPSLSIYMMRVCGAVICDRVMGVAPGRWVNGANGDCKERCKVNCDAIRDGCHEDCTKRGPTSTCRAKCNADYAKCLRKCEDSCR